MTEKCSHIETAYCQSAGLPDGRSYHAEVCACGVLRAFRVAERGRDNYQGASVLLLPEGQRRLLPKAEAFLEAEAARRSDVI